MERKGIVLGLPVIAGSIVGARIAVEVDEEAFEKIVAGIMLLMLALIVYKPQRWVEGRQELIDKKISWKQGLSFFAVADLAGGFIYVGIGYLFACRDRCFRQVMMWYAQTPSKC
ncbi:MAG: sulfite exporter TauE/SafE family protein [Bacteroidales bacterium]|nr:sulfite exporter TauE/SafE family protein [Bacteroidales bacterium]